MNKLIEEQLKNVLDADLSHFNVASNTFFIPKKISIKINTDCYYLIKLKEQVFSNITLRDNWNHGSIPPGKCMKIDVCNKLGEMIKVNCIIYNEALQQDTNISWSGWLPLKEIEVLKQL